MRFSGLTKQECPLPFLAIEVKGLGLAQDLKHGSNISGRVVLSQRRQSATTSATDDEGNISISVKISQFALQKAMIPFAKESREGDPSYSEA